MARRRFTMTEDGERAVLPMEKRTDGVCDSKLAFAARLKELRTRAGLSSSALASSLGVSPAAVSNWESGRTRPDIANIPAICEALGVGVSEFFPGAGASENSPEERRLLRDYRMLDEAHRAFLRKTLSELLSLQEACPAAPRAYRPLIALPYALDALAAGTGDPTSAFNARRRLYVCENETTKRAAYAFRVNGESMLPEFRSGDTVLVEKVEGALRSGEIGAFSTENELYIKEYRPDGLYSLNPAYPPRLFRDCGEVRLIGRVIGLLRDEDRADTAEIRLFKEAAHERS